MIASVLFHLACIVLELKGRRHEQVCICLQFTRQVFLQILQCKYHQLAHVF